MFPDYGESSVALKWFREPNDLSQEAVKWVINYTPFKNP